METPASQLYTRIYPQEKLDARHCTLIPRIPRPPLKLRTTQILYIKTGGGRGVMAARATSQKNMLQLMGALDRVLLAGQRGLYADPQLPPSAPTHHEQRRTAPSLGRVALVSVDSPVFESWKKTIAGQPSEYTLQHTGVTTSQAQIQPPGKGLHPLDVSNITSVRVVTPQISHEAPLDNMGQVGLVITTVSGEHFLFTLKSNISLMTVGLRDVLKRFTAFLTQDSERIPISVEINPNCGVVIHFDAGYTFAFNPIPVCYTTIR
jgi:hypothetical protein